MSRIEKHLPAVAAQLAAIARSSSPREACGYLSAAGSVGELQNRHDQPTECFDMGALADIAALEGDIAAIWHTHPGDEPPSGPDIEGCRATWMPWIIAGPSRLWVIYPEAQPYAGRQFVYGVTDCWQLVADWFAQERGRHLPWFPRPADGWWRTDGPSPYLGHAEDYGFTIAPWNASLLPTLQRGDVLLMRVAGRRTNHAAVYLGGGNILHHLYGCLSRVQQLDGQWQRFLTHHARLK